ncbi:hypothetical protein MRB53_011974 [Persea americana]|uniref:Uncharacterized protein n=1 Tax=Persea americana TaxID=3435 RepID=A0ACC2LW21_PERAE|nr:hypothetical protein MRB53_011974 [Persea americana]
MAGYSFGGDKKREKGKMVWRGEEERYSDYNFDFELFPLVDPSSSDTIVGSISLSRVVELGFLQYSDYNFDFELFPLVDPSSSDTIVGSISLSRVVEIFLCCLTI